MTDKVEIPLRYALRVLSEPGVYEAWEAADSAALDQAVRIKKAYLYRSSPRFLQDIALMDAIQESLPFIITEEYLDSEEFGQTLLEMSPHAIDAAKIWSGMTGRVLEMLQSGRLVATGRKRRRQNDGTWIVHDRQEFKPFTWKHYKPDFDTDNASLGGPEPDIVEIRLSGDPVLSAPKWMRVREATKMDDTDRKAVPVSEAALREYLLATVNPSKSESEWESEAERHFAPAIFTRDRWRACYRAVPGHQKRNRGKPPKSAA